MAPDNKTADVTNPSDDSEITTEITSEKKIGLKEVLVAELQELAVVGMSLKRTYDTAKTAPKKKLYAKKLKKNSNRAAEILIALERLQITSAIRKHKEEQELIDIRNNEDATAGGRTSAESEQA